MSPEVAALLRGESDISIPVPDQAVKLNLENVDGLDAGKEASPRITVKPAAQWDTENPANKSAPWSEWERIAAGMGKITVTETDKTLFLKAAMYDEEITLPIDLPGNMRVNVKSLSNKELRSISIALQSDRTNKVIVDEATWGLRLQYYSAALQIESVGDGDKGLLPVDVDVKNMRAGDMSAWLTENIDDVICAISTPRFSLLTQAIRIFEVKLARCKEGLANGDFFVTADMSS